LHFSPSQHFDLELTTTSRNRPVQSVLKWSNFNCAVLFPPHQETILIGAKLSEDSGMTSEALLIEDGADDRIEVKLHLLACTLDFEGNVGARKRNFSEPILATRAQRC